MLGQIIFSQRTIKKAEDIIANCVHGEIKCFSNICQFIIYRGKTHPKDQ